MIEGILVLLATGTLVALAIALPAALLAGEAESDPLKPPILPPNPPIGDPKNMLLPENETTANDMPTDLSLHLDEATTAAARRGDWDAAMRLRDRHAIDTPTWERFNARLHAVVRTRVGRPWLSDVDLLRHAQPADFAEASKS